MSPTDAIIASFADVSTLSEAIIREITETTDA
jgi:hypothetical protein